MMKTSVTAVAILFSLSAVSADAACYADYKAKKNAPLKLHYGVIQLPDAACNNPAAASHLIATRIARGGWQLLNVMSFFGPEGLDQRKGSAGNYFLRF